MGSGRDKRFWWLFGYQARNFFYAFRGDNVVGENALLSLFYDIALEHNVKLCIEVLRRHLWHFFEDLGWGGPDRHCGGNDGYDMLMCLSEFLHCTTLVYVRVKGFIKVWHKRFLVW